MRAALVALLMLVPVATAHGVLPWEPGQDPLPLRPMQWTPEGDVAPMHFSDEPYPQDLAGEYSLAWECPPSVSGGAGGTYESVGCPIHILDAQDVLSSPVMVVDPQNTDLVAFHALHGGPGTRTPADSAPRDPWAREDAIHQPHTVFTSRTGGGRWTDNPYYSPFYEPPETGEVDVDPYPRSWGIDNALTRDHRGDMYVASLYAIQDAEGEPLHYAAGLWKSGQPDEPFNRDSGTGVIRRAPEGSSVGSLHAGYVKDTKDAYVLWFERPAGGAPFVRLWHQDIDSNGVTWKEAPRDDRVEGCTGISNPVTVSGAVYIACAAGPDHPEANATEGVVQIHRYLPDEGWRSEWVGQTPLPAAQNLVLASAESGSKGNMAIMSAGVAGGQPYAVYSLGLLGTSWRPPLNYGGQLTATVAGGESQEGAVPIDARITAMTFVRQSSTFHFIYMERWDVSGASQSAKEYHKIYGVVHANGQFLGTADLGYGDPRAQANIPVHVSGTDSTVFFDLHDTIVTHTTRAGEHRIFVAFGDHGFVRYGEATELQPPPAIALIPLPPPAVPVLLTTVNPGLVGAGAGVLSGALLLRLLAAKKKVTAEAPSL